MSTYVCYYLPSDKDDVEHPNAFAIDKSTEEVTLRDIKSAFPLPGEYHFRFKVKLDNGSYWLDFTRDDDIVPAFGHRRIVAKVLRLSWSNATQKPVTRTTAPVVPTSVPKHVIPDHVDLFGGNTPGNQPGRTAPPTNTAVTELDLFS